VRRLRQFFASLREEDVAEHDAADGGVGVRGGVRARAVRPRTGGQLSFIAYAIGRTPDRPCFADPQLDVLVEEAAADKCVPGNVDSAELLGILGLEEEGSPGARALKPCGEGCQKFASVSSLWSRRNAAHRLSVTPTTILMPEE
jgi:hypothetical protein